MSGEKLMPRVFQIFAVLCALLSLPTASVVAKENEEATRAALVKIAGEGLVESHAFEYLTQLSDDVGARVTGSPQSQKAVEWSLSQMRSIGLENVYADKFQIWWSRRIEKRGHEPYAHWHSWVLGRFQHTGAFSYHRRPEPTGALFGWR